MPEGNAVNVDNITPLPDCILVTELLESWDTVVLESGIILPPQKFSSSSIKARFGKIYALGEEIDWLEEGQWILVENGRWTEKFKVTINGNDRWMNRVDPNGVLAVYEGEGIPVNEYIADDI